jgi:hypothetical protein
MKRKLAALGTAVFALLVLAGCKEIDVSKTGAKQVQGTDDLWWFCDGTTLIYVEKYNGDDSYEAFFAWGCNPDGSRTTGFPDLTSEGQGNQEEGK